VLRWLAISHTHGIRPSCHASPTAGSSSNRWRWIERLAWATGVVCVGVWALAMATGAAGARKETARFAAARELRAETAPPDFKGWSKKRMLAWQATLRSPDPVPLAVLRIPRIVLEVAVLEGTGDWTLNRAVGHIEDTAVPGTAGNVGIAGHRDGFSAASRTLRPAIASTSRRWKASGPTASSARGSLTRPRCRCWIPRARRRSPW
jgi:hypothetical protein